MTFADVNLKADGYHINWGKQTDVKNRKIFIPRKSTEKFDCFQAFDNYFMRISSGLTMGRCDPLFLGIIQTDHSQRMSKFRKTSIGLDRVTYVGKHVAIALGKKHPKEYNHKSLIAFTRAEEDDDKTEVMGLEPAFQGDPTLLEWCTSEQERDSWQLFIQTVDIDDSER